MKELTEEQKRWKTRIRSVSKERRKQIMTDAHDIGGLSYKEIADEVGDVSRQRIIQIVKEVRAERAQTT